MRWKWNFATECPAGQRGRPLSPGSVEKAGSGNVCEKRVKTGARKGQTIYYRTGGHRAAVQKMLESKRQEKKKGREAKQIIALLAKQEKEKRRAARKERPARGKSKERPANEPLSELRERVKQLTQQLVQRANEAVSSAVAEISVKSIAVDPKRFQYKILGEHTKEGEVGSLADIKAWNPDLAGIVQVWKDSASGQIFVVNGHNRLALAKRHGVNKIAVRFLAVSSDKEARAVGALTNIAEGRGTALDAAKFFRDTGLTQQDLVAKGVRLKDQVAADGLGLAALPKVLFQRAIEGELSLPVGAAIGRTGFDENKQYRLAEMVSQRERRGHKVDADTVANIADIIRESVTTKTTEEDLFGDVEKEDDHYFELADLQQYVKRRLSREQRIFGTATRGAKELSEVGSLDVEKSASRAGKAREFGGFFDEIKNTKGEVRELLDKSAARIKTTVSKQEREKIQEETYRQIYEALPKMKEQLWKSQ